MISAEIFSRIVAVVGRMEGAQLSCPVEPILGHAHVCAPGQCSGLRRRRAYSVLCKGVHCSFLRCSTCRLEPRRARQGHLFLLLAFPALALLVRLGRLGFVLLLALRVVLLRPGLQGRGTGIVTSPGC